MDIIHVWTDGSCLGNPGPMGYGIILKYKESVKKLSGYCGSGTSQRAEIYAFIEAMRALKEKAKEMQIVIYTDSQYIIGCLSQGWKWKKNTDLLTIAKQYMDSMNISFTKIKGHSDNTMNETCDWLAKIAASQGAAEEASKKEGNINENTNNNNTNNNNIMHNNV
jgi:ribonuclease HI